MLELVRAPLGMMQGVRAPLVMMQGVLGARMGHWLVLMN